MKYSANLEEAVPAKTEESEAAAGASGPAVGSGLAPALASPAPARPDRYNQPADNSGNGADSDDIYIVYWK